MLPGAIVTETASGTATGFLPIRLISSSPRLPDVGDYLAADALLARFVAGHHAGRGADDRGPRPTLDPRHVFVVHVAAAPGPGDPFDPQDDRPTVLGVLEGHLDRLAHRSGLLVEVGDVALLLEDARELHLLGRGGDGH